MTDVPAKSCRIFVRYGNAPSNCLPTEDDLKEIFSVHGNIVGMFSVKGYIIFNNVTIMILYCYMSLGFI